MVACARTVMPNQIEYYCDVGQEDTQVAENSFAG